MDRLVITGALGTLGRFTVSELKDRYEIVGLDVHEPRNSPDGVEFLGVDLTEHGPTWELIERLEADTVIHLAAIPGADHRADTETFLDNVASAYNVLTASGRVGANVVWSSSEATYGVTHRDEAQPLGSLPIDETHPQRPIDGYGLSKLVGETIAERTVRRDGISVTSIQPSWVQVPGAYETPPIRERFSLDNPTPSGSLWSYIDARDGARLIRLAVESPPDGHERYLAAAGDNYLGVPTTEAIEAAWGDLAAACDIKGDDSAFSTAKARRELGWEPAYSWRESETADVEVPTYR